MIVEEKIQENIESKYFEIYDIKDMETVNGSIVQVKTLIDTVSKDEVESRIADRNRQIEQLEASNIQDNDILTNINSL